MTMKKTTDGTITITEAAIMAPQSRTSDPLERVEADCDGHPVRLSDEQERVEELVEGVDEGVDGGGPRSPEG